jgi:hypothetical protein
MNMRGMRPDPRDGKVPTPKLIADYLEEREAQLMANRRRSSRPFTPHPSPARSASPFTRRSLFRGTIAVPRPTRLGWLVLAIVAASLCVAYLAAHRPARFSPFRAGGVSSLAGRPHQAAGTFSDLRRELNTTNAAVIAALRQSETADRKATTALRLAKGELPGVGR